MSPYTGTEDKSLPKYVKSRSKSLRAKWVTIFNAAHKKYGEEKALVISNKWLKKQLTPKKSNRTVIRLEADESKHLITRDSNGDDYVSFVLSSLNTHKDGKRFSEANLKSWADEINNNPIIGDVDHALYYKLADAGVSDDTIISLLKGKKGIAKSVKAIYEKGKLWVRAIIDKRYKRLIEKSKGVSVETVCDLTAKDEKDWDLLGFTFNVNTEPADYSAGVVA